MDGEEDGKGKESIVVWMAISTCLFCGPLEVFGFFIALFSLSYGLFGLFIALLAFLVFL